MWLVIYTLPTSPYSLVVKVFVNPMEDCVKSLRRCRRLNSNEHDAKVSLKVLFVAFMSVSNNCTCKIMYIFVNVHATIPYTF